MDTQSSTELTQHTAQCCAPLLPAHSYTSPAEHGEPPLPPPPNTSYPQGPCLLLGEKSASRLRMCMSHVALVIHPTPHVCEKTHMCSVATRAQLSADAATKPFSSADSWRSSLAGMPAQISLVFTTEPTTQHTTAQHTCGQRSR